MWCRPTCVLKWGIYEKQLEKDKNCIKILLSYNEGTINQYFIHYSFNSYMASHFLNNYYKTICRTRTVHNGASTTLKNLSQQLTTATTGWDEPTSQNTSRMLWCIRGYIILWDCTLSLVGQSSHMYFLYIWLAKPGFTKMVWLPLQTLIYREDFGG